MSIVASALPSDTAGLVANAGVFAATCISVGYGMWAGLKKIREGKAPTNAVGQMAAGFIMENMTARDLSKSNRDLAEATRAQTVMTENLVDAVRDIHRELTEHRIKMIEMMGRMDR